MTALSLASWHGARAQSLDASYKSVDGLAAYLGIIPAQVLKGHPSGHHERSMHGGTPGGVHVIHLVVALFDAESGDRIENADVSAHVSGLGGVGAQTVKLDPMRIANTTTFGGFIDLSSNDLYDVQIRVTRSRGEAPVILSYRLDDRRR